MNFYFTTFIEKYKLYYPNRIIPTTSFLEWFVGFSEGDGSFIVNSRGTSIFVITQSTEDIQILFYIKTILGFGRVIKQGNSTSRFIVEDLSNLQLIISIFNGNIVFPEKKKSFEKFLESYNNRAKSIKISKISQIILPTIDNY